MKVLKLKTSLHCPFNTIVNDSKTKDDFTCFAVQTLYYGPIESGSEFASGSGTASDEYGFAFPVYAKSRILRHRGIGGTAYEELFKNSSEKQQCTYCTQATVYS
jgi:hypothetical protein